jgi:DNA-binding MarR family transcriptional regulator
VSREGKINPQADVACQDASAEDVHLQIHLRLSLDQVAENHAEMLKRKAHRPPSQQELCRLACRIFDARRTRDRMLDRKLFGEPAWDMLLALYCLPARGELLTVTALTYAADIAQATGNRWQTILGKHGLIERGPHGVDARKQTVRLTPEGRKLLDAYLTKLFYCDTPVPPYSVTVDN